MLYFVKHPLPFDWEQMKRRSLALICLLLLLFKLTGANALVAQETSFDQDVAPLLKTYCLQCHSGNDDAESDVNLKVLNSADVHQHLDLIQEVIQAIDFEEMPPADAPQPDDAIRQKLVSVLKGIVKEQAAKSSFASTPIRRVTRFQYNNAVVDLFDLNCVVFSLPERAMRVHSDSFRPESKKMADVVLVGNRPLGKSQMIEPRLSGVVPFPQDLRAEHGFDIQADHLSLSPLLMESFLNLGQSIVESPEFNRKRVGRWGQYFGSLKGSDTKHAPPVPAGKQRQQVATRLESMLTRAFRRPAESALVNRYTDYVMAKMDAGVSLEAAMKQAAAAMIASPKFLYLYNTGEEGSSQTQFNLASQLSFFLWGSIPDEQLMSLAAKGQLSDKKVLGQQVDRMLKDRKIKRFCDSFPTQWLQLDRIVSSTPSREKFGSFYFQNGGKYRMSMHMMLEPLLLFETVLIEDLPITQLIDSDFTYRSLLLNNMYGELKLEPKPNPKRVRGNNVGSLAFLRMPVTDKRTGGVITNAATMTMTSGVERTKPITRGAWIATVIFNNPPEPPPADVPELEETTVEGQDEMTLREQLSLHRTRASCRGCHEQLDPLGFALENFDPIGRWRVDYASELKIDVSGELFRQHKFETLDQFKAAILAEKDRFARGLAGHLLSFALARPLNAADQPALDKIVELTAKDGYKMKTLIKRVVLSEPFLRSAQVEQRTGEMP